MKCLSSSVNIIPESITPEELFFLAEPETMWHRSMKSIMEWQRMSHLAARGDEVSVTHAEHIF